MKCLTRFLTLCVALVGVTFPASSLLFGQTVTPAATSYSFGSINVCPSGKATPTPCSATHTVSFDVAAGTTIGGIDIVLQGAPNLDYKAKADDTSTTLCAAKLYTEATTCTVDVTFAPLLSGGRKGAVEILGGNGALLATSYVSGIGVGPQIAFSPATQVSHAVVGDPGFDPLELAVDGGGNLFFTVEESTGAHLLEELTAASGYTQRMVLTTIVNVTAMTVDGAGNLFLVDIPLGQKNEEVRELFANGAYTGAKVLLSDTENSLAIAVDGAGNLFMAGFDGLVREYLAAGGYTTNKTLGSGFNLPQGLAIDGSGNIFVADTNNDAVKEIVAASGYTTIKTLNSGLGEPEGLAVDAAGNLFAIDIGLGLIEIVAAGGYTTTNTLLNDKYPTGVAVDGNGNIFTSDIYKGKIVELLRSQPPSLQFAPTDVDSTSDGPLSVTAQNIGNATLTGSGLAFTDSDDFTRAAGSGTPPDCTSSFSLSPGAECNLGVDFTPAAAGTLSGSLVLTDNALNTTAATQSIPLSGNGITAGGPVAHVSATALNYGSIAFPGTATKSLTITNTGGGKLTIGPSTASQDYKVTGSTCAGGITTGSCVLQVEFNPTMIGSHPDTLTLATNGPTNPGISLTGTAAGVSASSLNGVEQLSPITSVGFGTIYFPSTSNVEELYIYEVGLSGPVTAQLSIDGPDYKITANRCSTSGVTQYGCYVAIEFSPLTLGGHYEHLTITPSVGAPSTIELIGTAGGTVP
jgi:hypothetical protein